MRITSLVVDNFRAVRHAELHGLSDMVVIAGPNGCGKSCLFDAIRLLKSAYGGYNPNEWQQWFGEFQISLDRPQPELLPLFREKDRPIEISAEVTLEPSERDYLLANATELLRPIIWRQVAPGKGQRLGASTTPVAAQLRTFGRAVDEGIARERELLAADLARPVHSARVTVEPSLAITATESATLQLVYSLFLPDVLGIIDYHSAQRSYQREQVGGINLSIESTEKQFSQHALYNYAGKYQNIKSQMATSYIREILAAEAGLAHEDRDSLIATLQELFRLFFPDKQFLGPRPTPDGGLLFPVRTTDGIEHDINDLSSGEKEVLYGYLRIRNVAPKNSVLLLDEPELHLNPRLIRGLPQFYHRHLGRALNNQIWLLTHSDVLLKESIGQEGFGVYHMVPATPAAGDRNQLQKVDAGQEVQRALIALVGEVAAYRPGTIEDDTQTLQEIKVWAIDRLLRFKKVFGPKVAALVQ